ncbi:metal-dependent transcriptional regulator [Chitinophaga cymbidii]|uniref:Transcriptional regulator MntR n=1 Tax=Chitinophaga cymbidii TaxID=1096750 RepID=A0A512RS86_9BACT|nr:metal-dependent transcriptional regulator [Chitinophaga cymbidii]GEP98554.1 iron-dependent repressor [Chitinophaga cymbidii]
MHSITEENYLKAIYTLQGNGDGLVSTSDLAKALGVQPASVTDMVKKIVKKKLITYLKMKGVRLTEKGKLAAIAIIRKHRLWECFLVNKLGFKWDEVHEVAEQLEHVQSEQLIARLDEFLGFPVADPHGDPIPDANGVFSEPPSFPLATLSAGGKGKFVGVIDHSPAFLTYLDKIGLALGDLIKVKMVEEFDKSLTILLKNEKSIMVSFKVANNLLVS